MRVHTSHKLSVLPRVRRRLAESVESFLLTKYQMQRPPIVSSEVLALAIELSRLERPFPPLDVVARAIGASVAGVYLALRAAESRGLVTNRKDDGFRFVRPTRRLLAGIAY